VLVSQLSTTLLPAAVAPALRCLIHARVEVRCLHGLTRLRFNWPVCMPTDPQYLVRYYRGTYDPSRVKVRSRPATAQPQASRSAPSAIPLFAAPAQILVGQQPVPSGTSATYCHVAPDGQRTNFSPQDCALIHQAKMRCDGCLYYHDSIIWMHILNSISISISTSISISISIT
jgi:hypothetical protein